MKGLIIENEGLGIINAQKASPCLIPSQAGLPFSLNSFSLSILQDAMILYHGGRYRTRTCNIHGVNVALYQLS